MDILKIVGFVGWIFLSMGVGLFGIDFFLRILFIHGEGQISKEAHNSLIILATVFLLLGILLILVSYINPSFFYY